MSRDIVLVQGIEPSARWRSFTIELLEFAQQLGITTFVTLGALLADVPHTRPLPVSATSEHEDLAHRLDLEPSKYEGPTGIVGVLADAASQSDLAALSCWAAVPHYAGGTPSPKATLAIISKLEELFTLTIPRGDLVDQARAWEKTVDELAESDEEVADYIRALEQAQDTVELPEASGDAIAREFERYLRRRSDDPPAS
jgi:predicted ATP-grasp superfamily ATP-dependent carboligase